MKQPCLFCGFPISQKDTQTSTPEVCSVCALNLQHGLTKEDITNLVQKAKTREEEQPVEP